MTEYLKQVSTNLTRLQIPVLFKVPDASVKEPFFVIGPHFDSDNNPKYMNALVTTQLQIDLFYPIGDQAEFEDAVTKSKQAMQPAKSITTTTTKDNTIGRTVNRATFEVTKLLI
jgi:hypothetical protein